jgi:hypothetical protein
MVLSKKVSIVVFIVIQLLGGCENKKSNPLCGEASIHLMFSLSGKRLEDIRTLSNNADTKADGLLRVISKLEESNNVFITLAGGFKPGKNLEIIDPCRKGEQIFTSVRNLGLEKAYKDLVNQCLLTGLIDEKKANNMNDVINGYFCEDSCVFSEKNLNQIPIGLISLENFVLQFTLLELINL